MSPVQADGSVKGKVNLTVSSTPGWYVPKSVAYSMDGVALVGSPLASNKWLLSLDTTKYADGVHTVKAVTNDGVTATRSITIRNAVSPPTSTSPYSIVFSTSSTRSNPIALQGATVAGNVYAFTTPDTGVSSVAFSLDGVAVRTEIQAPYDFGGTNNTNLSAVPWNSTAVSNATHTIAAKVTLTTGATYSISSTFTVANGTTTTTVAPTTTTTAPPTTTTTIASGITGGGGTTLDVNRYSGVLGMGQSSWKSTEKHIIDAINDAPNSRARLFRVEASVPANSAWNYTDLDTKFAAAQANGVQVLLLPDYTPQELFPTYNGAAVHDLWGSTSPSASIHTFPRDPALQDKWVAYVMNLVVHAETKYPGVIGAIEWGNEPNGWEFGSQQGQYPFRPADYASLLKKAHTALKATYPGIVSITGGTSTGYTAKVGGGTTGTATDSYTSVSPATWSNPTNYTGWYDLLKAAGAQPGTHFDGITGHFYDTTIDSNWSQPFDKLWAVWSGPQVWATEQGATSNSAERSSASQSTQQTWVKQNLDLWRGKGTKAGAYIYFCEWDMASHASTTVGQGFGYFGLRDSTGAPKLAFAEFANRNGAA